jgi:hypothetical protein
LLDLGLLAHYSGDASMPFHATSDFNGWKTGEGGIHFYFENDCVDELEPGLSSAVLSFARKHRQEWLARWGALKEPPVGFLLHVYWDSALAIDRVSKLDRSKVMLAASSPDRKTPAKRRPPAQGCLVLRPLLVESLARGAVATAYLWEVSLPREADLSGAGSLQFSDLLPHPGYVAPAY